VSFQGQAVTMQEIARLLASGPNERVAFMAPHAGPARLAATLTALANAHGGIVVLGATAGGRPTGLEDAGLARNTAAAAAVLLRPPLDLPELLFLDLDGRLLGLLEVPAGLPDAYSLSSRYLIRAGKWNRLPSTAELAALLLGRSEALFESRAAPGALLEDLDHAQIQRYLERAPGLSADWQSLLVGAGCLSPTDPGPLPTYAGILLFGLQPQRFLSAATITLARYGGPSSREEHVRVEAAGTLGDQIEQAEAFVSANMRRGLRLEGRSGAESPEYPISAVREAIVNAVAHRDYAMRGDGVRIEFFSDRMEIYSPGRLPGYMTPGNVGSERFTRNPTIARILAGLGFGEQLGHGTERMAAAMAGHGLPAPVFVETIAGFRVTLHSRGDDLVSPEPAPRWGNFRLSPHEERTLAYLAEHGSISSSQLLDLCPELDDESARQQLATLVDRGLIMKAGDRRETHYILK